MKSISETIIEQKKNGEPSPPEGEFGFVGEESTQPDTSQKKPTPKEKEGIEGIAEDLNLNLPEVNLPLSLKLIALFTLIGGLGIVGSTFADIFNPTGVGFKLYIVRLVAGIAFMGVAYGMIKRRRWALWVYGAVVTAGLFVNAIFSIVPVLIVVYLFFKRRYFWPSLLDKWLGSIFAKLEDSFHEKNSKLSS